jgi:hypothetical protein
MSDIKNNFKLHFIGQGMYNTDIFEREAKRLGVQRAIAFVFLKGLKWGDPVLLARYIPSLKVDIEKDPEGFKLWESGKGSAEVFGYFTITGLSHTMPRELSDALKDKLNIVRIDDNSHGVSRACGSYSIGAVAVITDTLEELVAKIRELLVVGEFGVNNYKWFLTGHYTSLVPFILKPSTFSRGLQNVYIENLNLSLQQTESANLIWLFNYKKRGYMNKLMKQRFMSNSKSDFIDSF